MAFFVLEGFHLLATKKKPKNLDPSVLRACVVRLLASCPCLQAGSERTSNVFVIVIVGHIFFASADGLRMSPLKIRNILYLDPF